MPNPDDAARLTDEQFIAEFERCGFERIGFPHRSHVRMAWIYVRQLGPSRAVDRAAAGIRKLAASNGQSELYHDTITRAWVYLVAAAVSAAPERSTISPSSCDENRASSTRRSSPTSTPRSCCPAPRQGPDGSHRIVDAFPARRRPSMGRRMSFNLRRSRRAGFAPFCRPFREGWP